MEGTAAEYERFLVSALGETAVAELTQAMLDIAVAPADLASVSWPKLAELRDRALGVVRADLEGRRESECRVLRENMEDYAKVSLKK